MLGPPVQIAYAVDDAVEAARRWVARGVGPFFVLEHIEVRNVRVRGDEGSFDHSSAYAQWGPLMVELICQHDGGPNPVVGRTGVHHMAHFVDDFAAASTSLTEQGAAEALYAETSTGMPFAFHDARAERGHFIEIYERTERLGRFYDMVREAASGWNGTDAIRRL
ncbi:MAG: VOC family protein [Ilumatobacteraceae bacterium]